MAGGEKGERECWVLALWLGVQLVSAEAWGLAAKLPAAVPRPHQEVHPVKHAFTQQQPKSLRTPAPARCFQTSGNVLIRTRISDRLNTADGVSCDTFQQRQQQH